MMKSGIKQILTAPSLMVYLALSLCVFGCGRGNSISLPATKKAYTNKTITPQALRAAVSYGLDLQAAANEHPDLQDWLDFIAAVHADERLTDAESDQFLRQMVQLHMTVRSPIRVGDRIALNMVNDYRAPSDDIAGVIATDRLVIDGDAYTYNDIWSGEAFQGIVATKGPVSLEPGEFPPGEYNITYHATIAFYHSTVTDGAPFEPEGAPFATTEVSISSSFEIVPADGVSDITLVTDTKVGSALRSAMTFNWCPPVEDDALKMLSLTFETIQALPVGISFDVIVVAGDRRIEAEYVCFEGGASVMRSVVNHFYSCDFDYESARIILKPNSDWARQTMDMKEIWGEEIEIGADDIGVVDGVFPG